MQILFLREISLVFNALEINFGSHVRKSLSGEKHKLKEEDGTFNSGDKSFRYSSSRAACDGVYGIHLPEFKSKPSIKEDVVRTGVISACNHPLNCHIS